MGGAQCPEEGFAINELDEYLRAASQRRSWVDEGHEMKSWDIAAVSAPDEDGNVVSSPNVPYLFPAPKPLPSTGAELYVDDLHGYHESTRLPNYIKWDKDVHLACILLAPKFRQHLDFEPLQAPLDSLEGEILHPLWWSFDHRDFIPVTDITHTSQIERGSFGSKIEILHLAYRHIDTIIADLNSSQTLSRQHFAELITCLRSYSCRVREMLVVLRRCQTPYLNALDRVRETQRLMLEMIGHLIYQLVVSHRLILPDEPPPTKVLPCIGGFASKLQDVHLMHHCGLPVWDYHSLALVDSPRRHIYNRNQDLMPIQDIISLTRFTSENLQKYTLEKELHKKLQASAETVSVAVLVQELLPACPTYDVPRILVEDADLLPLGLELLIVEWLVHEALGVSQKLRPYPLHRTTNAIAHQGTSVFRFSTAAPGQKMQRFPTFKDLLSEVIIRDTGSLFRPFIIAAETLYQQPCPWPSVPASVYAFPPPSIFLRSNSERCQRIIRWLKMGPTWISFYFTRGIPQVQPLQPAIWRALLSAEEKTPKRTIMSKKDRPQKKLEHRDKSVERAEELLVHFPMLIPSNKTVLSAYWHDELLDEAVLAESFQIQEHVFYEFHHLNFIADFLSLEYIEMRHTSPTEMISRRQRFMQIFEGDPLLPLMDLSFPDIWSMEIHKRVQRLKPWFELMQEWPNCSPTFRRRLESVEEGRLAAFEQSMVSMYVARFVLKFRRWPVVPLLRPVFPVF